MAKRIDEIHDDLRHIVPIIQCIQMQQIGLNGQAIGQDEGGNASAWILLSNDRSYGFQLAPDQILFFSKKYTRYDDFSRFFEEGLAVLFKKMRFMDVTNIGVRYVDHIKPLESEKLEQYVIRSLLPVEFPELDRFGGTTTWTYKARETELRIRGNSHPGTWAFPDDLIGLLVMSQDPMRPLELESIKENEFLLDMDAMMVNSVPTRMEVADIAGRVKLLHEEANKFFRSEAVCTDHAFEIWKDESKK